MNSGTTSHSATMPMHRALMRALTMLAALVVTTSLLVVFVAGAILLRGYARDNLANIAWQASYTTEVAVVFNDRQAAAEAVRAAVGMEGVKGITISNASDEVIATVLRDGLDADDLPPGWLDPAPVAHPIVNGGTRIGEVMVHGETTGIGTLLLACLLGTLVAGAIAWGLAKLVGRRLRQTITEPLRAIAAATHDVRGEARTRAPRAVITEVDELSNDFNRLLNELDGWRKQVDATHKSLLSRASHDLLSGLPNRAHFMEETRAAMTRASRAARRLAILYLDGDGFKRINDQHGHAAGDAVIREIGVRLRSLPSEDILAARVGGDEFAILIPMLNDDQQLDTLRTAICDVMAPPLPIPAGAMLNFSLSCGHAIFPRDGANVESLIAAADKAMYANKAPKGLSIAGTEDHHI